VGPASAGAEPGPACYGRGGTQPTVTDANVLLGRIPAGAVFGDLGALDVDAARRACGGADVTAEGIVEVVNANMERALRAVTIERGVDARDVVLVAFGGAGPLHAAELATTLGINTVIVPPRAGVLSAVGLLCAPDQRDLVRSWPDPGDHDGLADALTALAEEAAARLGHEGIEVEVTLDCRYRGQSHELTVPSVAAFAAEHERRNGYSRQGTPVEVVAMRATARRPARFEVADLPVPDHRLSFTTITGPEVIAEPDSTVWVPAGWRAEPGPAGCLVLRAG
jgi:N-methylhydantoinase A/oxoprolinase/acetone carboxylase beta subunit